MDASRASRAQKANAQSSTPARLAGLHGIEATDALPGAPGADRPGAAARVTAGGGGAALRSAADPAAPRSRARTEGAGQEREGAAGPRDLRAGPQTGGPPRAAGGADAAGPGPRPPTPRLRRAACGAMSGGAGSRRPAPRSLSCVWDLDARAAPAPAPSGREPPPRPIIQRRARSLPSSPERRARAAGGAGAACGPGCRRQLRVRFADALGLELAQVKVFDAGDDPSVPRHVLSRLAAGSERCCGGGGPDPEFALRCLVPDFPPPVEAADFGERLGRQRVCLERVTCSGLGVAGTVRVRNLAFEKQVAVRYSLSGWRSAHEAAARWRGPAGAPGGAEDVFAFAFPVPPFLLQPGARVLFAVRYRVAGAEYWDNNDRRDYSLTCRSHPLRPPPGAGDDSWIHFI
ncbi:protein phosphatase 1 regulatory subunit 3D [Perognathus longimembris pacificus]|uniref:protein phosphatase 1 regulatory subunit 3D n=1 Tax=Perognathus longimembris pacificus TaxID=214514 RepID=UPI00201964CA|nr:protein phosphatase 1 regulatory subunit 3D [Perognathus longimembris pacificus]